MLIYHIVKPEDWENSEDEEFYEAENLRTENFIHCSYRSQLPEVLQRYYSDAERVLILHINPHWLTAPLICEASTNREIFPHIYGKINRRAIVEIEERDL